MPPPASVTALKSEIALPTRPLTEMSFVSGVAVEVEQRLRVEVAGDEVRLVEDAVRRISRRAFRIPHDEVLVRVGVGAVDGLEAAPRKRREGEGEVGDDAVVLGVDLVLVDVEVRVVDLRGVRREGGDPAPGAGGREVGFRVVGLRPEHHADERPDVSLVHLVVVGVGVGHREIGVQPRVDLGLRGARQVDAIVLRIRDDALLPVDGGAEPVVDPAVGRRAAEGQVVGLGRSGLAELADVVVELRAGGIGSAEVLEGADGAATDGRRTVDALELGVGAGGLEPDAVAVGPAGGAGLCRAWS